MATVLSQSDTDMPFPDCSITSLLPRTLGSSFAAGAAKFESDDLDYVGSLFNTSELTNSRQLLEHAKMISNSNYLSISNASLEGGNNILAMRSHDGEIDLQGKRARHRRPGLPGADRRGHVFNFSAKATAAEFSQMGTSDDFFKRSRCVETNSVAANQFGPVIDYSCLEHISDPLEYFSTYRMLENVDKEVRKLKGESSPKLTQSQGRRDRQRRPGLHDLEGKKYVFKFPHMTSTTEESQIENSTQSHGASINELTITSCSKEISQRNNSQTVEPESILAGDEEPCDKEIDELERLLSKCRKLDNDGIASVVRETLQINPIHVKKSRGFPFSVPTENKFESPQLSQILPVAKRNKIDGLSNLKGRLSWCDPFLPHRNDHDKQSDGSSGLGSNYKVFCVNGLEKLPSNEGGVLKEYLEKHKSDCNDISVDGITELEQEIFKTKQLDADEMANPVDHLSSFKMPIPLIDVQGRLAKISTLKRHMLQNTGEDEQLMFSNDGLKDSLSSERQELHSVSPVDITHFDDVSMDAQKLKRSNIEDKMHSLDTSEEDINLGERTISDHIGRQSILLEETSQSPNGTISDEKLVCIVSGAYFEQADQPAASVDHRSSESLANQSINRLHQPFVSLRTTDNSDLYGFHCTSVEGNSDAPEQISHAEALDDDSVPEDSTLMDKQFEVPVEVMNEKDKNQGCSEALEGPAKGKLERDEPPRRQRKQNSILRRKSLAGHGSTWESGVRRSTRIRVKPLQFWCGERFLYGRVHDSLATVIGVKKYETPPNGGNKTVMKVKSFVSEEYADLVAEAALY